MKNFSDFLNELAGRIGQGTLADQIGIDPSALSRFRFGQGALCLSSLDKLFEIAGACILPCSERQRLEDALETISELWSQERKKKKS